MSTRLLEGDAGAAPAICNGLVTRFELMRELALILNRKRVQRGAIDFDMPEPLIEFDEFGEMAGGRNAALATSRTGLIEEFLLGGQRSRGIASGAGRHPVAIPNP